MDRTAAFWIVCLCVSAAVAGAMASDGPASSRPAAQTQPAADEGVNPFGEKGSAGRDDAVPGVVELSDGTQLAGGLFGTLESPWLLYVEQEKRWRRIPFIDVLSITAEVSEEQMELEWRFKAMGEPEKVYTGRSYPTRRLLWKFHLIDGSYLTGTIKGQPLWVQDDGSKFGPFVLQERTKGEMGQKLAELIYVKRVIVSSAAIEQVRRYQKSHPQAAPAGQPR